MNLYIGKTVARCKHCESTDWLLLEPAGRFSILSDVVCAVCGMKHTYADLILQLPEGQAASQPPEAPLR